MTVHPNHPTGIKARIPAGTVISGTFPGGEKLAGRSYVVDVWDIHNGYLSHNAWDGRHRVGSPTQVCWVGTGQYWHYADLEDVEIVEGADRVEVVAHADRFPIITRAQVKEAILQHA